ncbi:MAG: hypothetical protein KDJ88_08420 [Bauldia sp.]|nr:hypothetical protein [Bauldia sp.]
MNLLADHPYLLSSLLGVPGVLIAFAAAGQFRTSIFVAGLVNTLYGLPVASFDAPYWTPNRIGGFPVGVEDVIVSFSLGAGVWFAAILPFGRQMTITGRWPEGLARFAWIGVGGMAFVLLARMIVPVYMPALLLVMIAMAFVLGWLRPHLLPPALAALLVYPVYYAAILYLTEAIVPGFFDIWDGPELWGPRLFGLPVEEIVFVAAFSFTFALIAGTVVGARVQPPARVRREG